MLYLLFIRPLLIDNVINNTPLNLRFTTAAGNEFISWLSMYKFGRNVFQLYLDMIVLLRLELWCCIFHEGYLSTYILRHLYIISLLFIKLCCLFIFSNAKLAKICSVLIHYMKIKILVDMLLILKFIHSIISSKETSHLLK